MTSTGGRPPILHFTDCILRADDRLFFDANIWLSLYDPHPAPNDWQVRAASDFFKRCNVAGSPIYTEVLVLTEVANRLVKRGWELHQTEQQRRRSPRRQGFKAFRQTPDGIATAEEAASTIRLILRQARWPETILDNAAVADAMVAFEQGGQDFNDQLIVQLCLVNGLTLVTNDADFKDCGLPLLTGNQHLLD